MADVVLYEGEKRFVRFPVTASSDPLADTVEIAFIDEGAEPVDSDWHPAEWVVGQTWSAGQPVFAGIEVGPVDIALTPGTYCGVLRILGDATDEPWIPAGTVRIRTAIPLDVLRKIREEVGKNPPDDEVADLYGSLQSVPAVALAILRPRLADALADRSLAIPGVISVGSPSDPKYLRDQIARLEGLLDPADPTEDAEDVTVLGQMTRRSQRRGLPYRP